MTAEQHYVLRAAWETLRRMDFSIDVANEFRSRLETQIDAWQNEDSDTDPEVIAA